MPLHPHGELLLEAMDHVVIACVRAAPGHAVHCRAVADTT